MWYLYLVENLICFAWLNYCVFKIKNGIENMCFSINYVIII